MSFYSIWHYKYVWEILDFSTILIREWVLEKQRRWIDRFSIQE